MLDVSTTMAVRMPSALAALATLAIFSTHSSAGAFQVANAAHVRVPSAVKMPLFGST
jgi:hypothetical protein